MNVTNNGRMCGQPACSCLLRCGWRPRKAASDFKKERRDMKELNLATIKRTTGLRHDSIDPDTEAFYRKVFALVGPYQQFKTLEQFEFVCCKNQNPASDAPYFAYLVGRLVEWRESNPTASPSKTQRIYDQFIRDYFRANPFVEMHHHDGAVERMLIQGYRQPTNKQKEDLRQYALQGFGYLDVFAEESGEVTP